jgi:hypothetical protein
MKPGKPFGVVVLVFFLVGQTFGQSIVETAKKEKDRREALKGGKIIAVTNTDLLRTKKKPALIETQPGAPPLPENAEVETETASALPTAVPAAASSAVAADSQAGALQSEPVTPSGEQQAELQNRYDRAKERAELLDLKMRSLRQQLFTFNSMSSKDQIQKAIGETYKTLLEAQTEATQAKADLQKALDLAAKNKAPALWIR